ncbi:hypothetical protein GPL15_04055 [Clostridium sp. MCC353]|uniref:hypothetical protein n=1 Tax=Clostridium sp. MCC353 TaxID=2592646 RepID=UPI001C00E085|nr:hypothetical protein [Clostridium sp. MCC353]MBT9775686.1 hypothetical protein [Clostridium sp. MCC353]
MKKRICPVCDHEMHSAHYCRICRSWVKEPYIREVRYYLNETHPKEETDCSYHNDSNPAPAGRGAVPAKVFPGTQKPPGTFYSSEKPAAPPPTRAGERQQPGGEMEKRKPGSRLRLVLWLFLFIYVIMPLFGSLIGTITYFFRHLF